MEASSENINRTTSRKQTIKDKSRRGVSLKKEFEVILDELSWGKKAVIIGKMSRKSNPIEFAVFSYNLSLYSLARKY